METAEPVPKETDAFRKLSYEDSRKLLWTLFNPTYLVLDLFPPSCAVIFYGLSSLGVWIWNTSHMYDGLDEKDEKDEYGRSIFEVTREYRNNLGKCIKITSALLGFFLGVTMKKKILP